MIQLLPQGFCSGKLAVLWPEGAKQCRGGRPAGRQRMRRRVVYLCACECGRLVHLDGRFLRTHIIKSCGCLRKEVMSKAAYRKRPYESLYNRIAKQTKHKNDLSYEQFVELTKQKSCHYCGASLRWAKFDVNKNGGAVNLDRKDSSKSYTLENVVPCCKRCNVGKNRLFTHEEWLQIGQVIRGWACQP